MELRLKNPYVLSQIADQNSAGSLFRLTLTHYEKSTKMKFEVVAENGFDILFKDKVEVKSFESERLTKEAIGMLKEYSKIIPFDGKVKRVNKNRVLINIINKNIKINQSFTIYRPEKILNHPLLKKIATWKMRKVSIGTINSIKNEKIYGDVLIPIDEETIREDDWVIFDL
jgi:hypothetical protein